MLNPSTLLPQVLPESKWFTAVDLHSAFFSSWGPLDLNRQYLFAWLGTIDDIHRQSCLRGPPRPLPISLKYQDLSTLQFPGDHTQYADDLLPCPVTKKASIKDSIFFLQQLAGKGPKVSKEKLQLSPDTVHSRGHNLNSEGIQLSPKIIKLIQEFLWPTADSFVDFWAYLAIASCEFLIFLSWFAHFRNLLKLQSLSSCF